MTGAERTLCQGSIRKHSRSFSLASRLLPPAARDDAAAVYAWCRRADDAIDLPGDETPVDALARLRRELAGLYAGAPQTDPVLAAFQDVLRRRRIPEAYPGALLDGMEMDVSAVRYERLETLLLYCYRVAGTVGLMMCHVLGVSRPEALRHAAHLGMAMQLTNICRDIEEDWRKGRLYLPLDLIPAGALELQGGREGGPVPIARGALAHTVARLLGLADVFYRSGDVGLAYLSWRARLGVRTARLVYSAIGARIRSARYEVSVRAVVPGLFKVLLVVVSVARALRELPGDLRARFRAVRLRRAVEYPKDVLPV
jgi:15-cis-phytoene synthase